LTGKGGGVVLLVKEDSMPRAKRSYQDGAVYHLISRGNNRRPIFETKYGYQRFKEVLMASRLQFDWRLYHYCLMPNHFHLLAYVQNGVELPKLMQYILQSYSRWYRNENEYIGYLWQGRYRSPIVDNDSYLLECGRYIERNPERAGLSSIENYPWSSYRHYASGKNDFLIYPNPIYQDFGRHMYERQEKYRDFAALRSPYEAILEACIS
jgi:putative transposase